MSNEEQAWSARGEPTTTAYGANLSGRNEFGQALAPKAVRNLHGIKISSRQPIPVHDLFHMVSDFNRAYGRMPTELHITGPNRGDKYWGLMAPLLGYVGLDIIYEAERNHVS